MLKIGIMGGTFNPIHNGHILAAKAACEQFCLDKVLFITGGNPPHKKNQKVLNKTARHKMVKLAIKGIEKFEAYDYEINKSTYSYTFETLKHIKGEFKDCQLYFITGADSFHDIPKWYKPRTIMELSTLLVYERDGYNPIEDYEIIKKEYYCKAEFINAEKIDVSSSQIRKMLENDEDVSNLVPKDVYDFIKRNNLYKKSNESLKKQLKKSLSTERFSHSLGVSMTAVKLAKFYNVNEQSAYTAGLLHDCAKNFSIDEMMSKCEDYDVELDEFEKENTFLIHAKLGEKVAAIEYGINDPEILEAIKWHTLGCVGMSDLSKIIFVADMIEPGRNFKGIEELRNKAYDGLDNAVAACINSTIYFNNLRDRKIHPNAYAVLEWLKNSQ